MEEVWVEEGVGKVRYGLGQEQQLVTSEQKITLGEMRAAAVRDLLVYCADYKCSHGMRMSADRWPDYVRLSVFPSGIIPWMRPIGDIEPAFPDLIRKPGGVVVTARRSRVPDGPGQRA